MKTDSNKPTEIIVPLGQALKDARLAASLTLEEVAEKLNFAPSTVRDFEDNLEQILLTKKYPVIYLRGYLANYAKLVGLNTLELFVEYQQLATTQKTAKKLPVSDLIIPQKKKRSKKLPLFLLLIAIIGAAIYLFQTQFFTPIEQTSADPESSVEVDAKTTPRNNNVLIAKGDLVSEGTLPESTNEEFIEPVVEQETKLPSIEQKTEIQTEPTDENIDEQSKIEIQSPDVNVSPSVESSAHVIVENSATELAKLSLVYSAECWTEVFDATGKRIAFGLYKDGRVLSLAGVAPFQLKLGDPSVVEIQYQDQIIEGEFTPGRSAQFSVPLS